MLLHKSAPAAPKAAAEPAGEAAGGAGNLQVHAGGPLRQVAAAQTCCAAPHTRPPKHSCGSFAHRKSPACMQALESLSGHEKGSCTGSAWACPSDHAQHDRASSSSAGKLLLSPCCPHAGVSDAARAAESTPPNTLRLVLHPVGAGQYPCRVLLQSVRDVRLLEVEFTAVKTGQTVVLEFDSPARERVVQEVRCWAYTSSSGTGIRCI